jgi:hypothetical protein
MSYTEDYPLAIPVLAAVILFFLLSLCSGGSGSGTKRTDGVYESATEKIDKGVPLNDTEAKRINDIMNYNDNEKSKEIEHRNGEN